MNPTANIAKNSCQQKFPILWHASSVHGVCLLLGYFSCGNLDYRPGSSTQVLTGAADNTARLWDCETGRELFKFETNSAVRTCCFSYSGKLFTYSTDMAMKSKCEIVLYDVRALESPIR